MKTCACLGELHKGDRVFVRACGCTGYFEYANVRRVFVLRVWLDRKIDVAECAKDMQRDKFWINEVHRNGCPNDGQLR